MASANVPRKGQSVTRAQLALNRAAGVKHCHACGETKPFACFSADKSRSDGLQPRCKDCYKVYKDANRGRIAQQRAGKAPTLAERYPEGVKRCEACQAVKSTAEFTKYAIPKETLSPTCNDCRAEHQREWEAADTARKIAWRKANPDWCRAYNLTWHRENPDKVRQKSSKWYWSNAERVRADANSRRAENVDEERRRERERYAANAAHIRRRKAEWRAANPDKERARYKVYRENNRDKVRIHWKARKSRKRGAGGSFTPADIAALMQIQKGKCAHSWCRTSLKEGHHIDHVMPLARGGSNDRRNLQLLCPTCNMKKHAKHPVDFAQENGLLL